MKEHYKVISIVVITWVIVFAVSQAHAITPDELIQEPVNTSVPLETAVYVHGKGWIMTPTPYPHERRGG